MMKEILVTIETTDKTCLGSVTLIHLSRATRRAHLLCLFKTVKTAKVFMKADGLLAPS